MQIQVDTDRHIEGSAKLRQEVESVVQHALGRFSDRITRVAVFLSDENSSQKSGDIDKRCVIEARLGGVQPITVSHRGSSLDQTLQGAAGKLEKTLKRTLGRKVSLLKRSVRNRAALTAAAPLLEQDAEKQKQEDFIEVLRPLSGHLADHARRELRILEANGSLSPGQLSLADSLDEMVTRAWLQFAARPRSMSLDLWLTKILDEVLEEQTRPAQPVQRSLNEPAHEARPRNVPQVDDQEWWVWLRGEDEGPAREDSAISRRSAWAEEFLEAEELVLRIHTLLGDLPKLERQAFVLNVLEAYELFEVAMLQDRPEADVRADVEAARVYLRQQLHAGAPPDGAADEAVAAHAAATENH